MSANKVLRSRSGMYHLWANSSSHCNGRSGKFSATTEEMVKNASESSFCKKCFWEGKEGALRVLINT